MGLFDSNDQLQPLLNEPAAGAAARQRASVRNSLSPQISACLHRGGLVLTGNARAARALGLAYAASQRRNGLDAWAAPQIADWSEFMASLWNQILLESDDAPLLLSSLQEHAVWKEIADRHGDAALVVSMDGMAELAQSAYSRLKEHDAHGAIHRSWDYAGSRDAEAFRAWAVSFEGTCAEERWISRSALARVVAAAITAGQLSVPHEVLLSGFDRVLPAQSGVLAALKSRGTRIYFAGEAEPKNADEAELKNAANAVIVQAKDRREEIAACAAWARAKLVAAPGAKIGVLLQDGTATRGEMERIFRRILLPDSLGIDSPSVAAPYEFSLGRPLVSVPVVRAAILLLRWFDEALPQEDVSWLLMSGFLGGGAEQLMPTARLDAQMRREKSLKPEVTLDWWLSHSDRYLNVQQAPLEGREVNRRLLHAQRTAARRTGTGERGAIRNSLRTYSQWVEMALEALSIAGWPGVQGEDSAQFQARKKFVQMTDSIAALGFDGRRVDYSSFISDLVHTSADTIFQPQSRDAPIQIMGPLEAAGQEFDAIWFLGVDDLSWPAKAAPHPLLPVQLQRGYKMPHADAQSDWELAARVTKRVAASAVECIFSYAMQLKAGAVKLSPVLKSVFPSLRTVAEAAHYLRLSGEQHETHQVSETIEAVDASAIPWLLGVNAGGTEIIKMQAACPFKAFATRRLGAGESDTPERGLSQKERGTIVHGILQDLWSSDDDPMLRLKSLDDLIQARAENRISAIVEHHVTVHLARLRRPDSPWETAYLANEKERLCALLAEWLDREVERLPFEVEECEHKLTDVNVGDLKLNLRIDRIDRLSDGGRLLIDYKTGKVTKSAWEGERPDEPQLPLYAAYGNVETLKGVLYAQLRANDLAFVGRIADSKHTFHSEVPKGSSVEKYESSTVGSWAATLLQLARDFIEGDASVDPKKYPKTCEYCPLPTLCRVADTPVPVAAMAIDDPEFDSSRFEARYE